jgi:type I restriction enzyme S subunit
VSKGQNTPGIARRRFRPYPGYKDPGVEWLGKIPAHWDITRIKEQFCIVNGSTPSSSDPSFWDGDIVWVTPDDLGELHVSQLGDSSRKITEEGYKSCGTSIVPKGSIVVSTRAPIGYVAIATTNLCTNQGCKSLVPKRPLSTGFFYYQLSSAKNELKSRGEGSTFKEISKDKLGLIILTKPPEPDQHPIAFFLDRETAKIDALVEKKERLIELLQEKRTALITQAVTKGLDPTVPMKDSGVEWLGEIPAHWEVKRLRHVGSAIIGLTYEPGDVVGPDEGMLVLRASNVCDGHIVLDDNVFVKRLVRDCLVTREGDILICSRSGSRNLIGKSAKIDKTVMGLTFGAFMTVFRSVCNDYLFYAFNSTLFNYQSGAFLTSTINQLTLGNLNSFTIPVPPSIEQIEITAFLDCEIAKIDALASRIREVIAHLREYRVALVSAAVTGKIDIRTEPVEARNAR